jgi:hypothetical protein
LDSKTARTQSHNHKSLQQVEGVWRSKEEEEEEKKCD